MRGDNSPEAILSSSDAGAEPVAAVEVDEADAQDASLPPTPGYAPADPAAKKALIQSAFDALQRVPYLDIIDARVDTKTSRMINVECRTREPHLPWHFIEIDLRLVWVQAIQMGRPSIHTLSLEDDAMVLRFAVFGEDETFITGRVRVARRERQPVSRLWKSAP